MRSSVFQSILGGSSSSPRAVFIRVLAGSLDCTAAAKPSEDWLAQLNQRFVPERAAVETLRQHIFPSSLSRTDGWLMQAFVLAVQIT